jgi:hypothetical protein
MLSVGRKMQKLEMERKKNSAENLPRDASFSILGHKSCINGQTGSTKTEKKEFCSDPCLSKDSNFIELNVKLQKNLVPFDIDNTSRIIGNMKPVSSWCHHYTVLMVFVSLVLSQ